MCGNWFSGHSLRRFSCAGAWRKAQETGTSLKRKNFRKTREEFTVGYGRGENMKDDIVVCYIYGRAAHASTLAS